MDATKTMVRSVLTSSPTSLTVDQLCKEYNTILGEHIPFRKLGYNSVEHFLRDIPDTVQLAGSGRYATVNLVFSEKSAHIAQMVSKQKLTKKKGANCQRRTVIVPAQQEKAYVNRRPVTTQRIVYPPAKPSNSTTQNNVKLNSTTQNNAKLNSTDFKNGVYGPPSPSISEGSSACASSPEQYKPSVKQFEYKNNNVDPTPKTNIQSFTTPKSNLTPVVRRNKSLSQNNFDTYQKAPQITKKHTNLSQNNFDTYQQAPRIDVPRDNTPAMTKNNLFTMKEEEENVPTLIKNNLRLIIKQHPDGVWCTELPNIYRKTFKRELKYFELGFKSLIELCMYLKSIFHWVRPGRDDFRLYDKSKPLPASAEKNFTVASYTKPTENSNIRLDNALPPLDWDDVLSFLPQNILQPGDEIARYFVPPETAENDIIDVVVGEICDASKFWVYPDNGKLDQLMDDMQVFYKKRGEKYKVPKELIRKGLYCASIIFGEYHRALITEVMNHGKNKIFYIDYGTIRTESTELYFLHNHFSELPAQTLRCRLAGICPVIKGAPWSPESTAEFRSLTKKSKFVAKIARIKWEDQVLEVFLADVTVPRVFYINDRLVEKGHAVFIDQVSTERKVNFRTQLLKLAKGVKTEKG